MWKKCPIEMWDWDADKRGLTFKISTRYREFPGGIVIYYCGSLRKDRPHWNAFLFLLLLLLLRFFHVILYSSSPTLSSGRIKRIFHFGILGVQLLQNSSRHENTSNNLTRFSWCYKNKVVMTALFITLPFLMGFKNKNPRRTQKKQNHDNRLSGQSIFECMQIFRNWKHIYVKNIALEQY